MTVRPDRFTAAGMGLIDHMGLMGLMSLSVRGGAPERG
jgi:hypothetical protein